MSGGDFLILDYIMLEKRIVPRAIYQEGKNGNTVQG